VRGPDTLRDKSLFLPLDTNEIGVKYEQREIPKTDAPELFSLVQVTDYIT
jgi:hypothetical protein